MITGMQTLVGRMVAVTALLLSASAAAQIQSDVIYGHKDGMALVYDVFHGDQPNGAGVIYMVSGGWFSVWQDPESRLPGFKPMLDAGFTVFAVHHGSAPRYKVPDAVSDVRAAVRHIKANADEFGVDPDRLGVYGGSAGGHLSLMLGLNAEATPESDTAPEGRGRMLAPQYAEADGDASLAAVVAYFPPVDLRQWAGPSERFPALDFSKEKAAAVSPIRFVDAGDPPVLLIHGDSDELVPLSNSEILVVELDKNGVAHDLLIIEGGGHGFRDPAHRAEATAAMVAWFEQYLVL
jgi:acetyl esterase/lipase